MSFLGCAALRKARFEVSKAAANEMSMVNRCALRSSRLVAVVGTGHQTGPSLPWERFDVAVSQQSERKPGQQLLLGGSAAAQTVTHGHD